MTSAQTSPYVLCEDLFKIYKVADLEVVALRGLDLSVMPGEVVAIVGASGSGKSTLLNILAGYDAPSAGGVSVGGNDLLRMNMREIEEYRREVVGFVWQQTSRNMFPYLSAVENVALPMMLTEMPGRERKERAEHLLDLVGLGHRLEHTPSGFPAASSSALQSRWPSPTTRRCCWPTSRRASWTTPPPPRYWTCSAWSTRSSTPLFS